MFWLNGNRTRLVVVGVVAAMVVGGGSAKADFTFGEPTNLGPTVNSAYKDYWPWISSDGLSLYFGSNRPDTSGERDIWVSTRATIEDDWGTPVNLGPPVNGPFSDSVARISTDELELYFASDRPPGSTGIEDIWVSRRASKSDVWGEPVNLGSPINSSTHDWGACLSADGLELYFNSMRSGGFGRHDIYVSTRPTSIDDWGAPINLGPPVNSSNYDIAPCISSDGLCLFFCDEPRWNPRAGGFGNGDIWLARRATIDDTWNEPVNLGATVNTSDVEYAPCISFDGSMLYFNSNRPGGLSDADIYQAPIIPIVDLNGDGIVDAIDMCIMVDNWGTDNSLCDIGPMPWGDGVVDVQDLIVLAKHLFEEFP